MITNRSEMTVNYTVIHYIKLYNILQHTAVQTTEPGLTM